MSQFKVVKIRPVSWRVYIQGEEAADQVRQLLSRVGIETDSPAPEPTLTDSAVYSVLATPPAERPMTSDELEAILAVDSRVKMIFEDA
jgi:hypothetical protein